MGTLDLTTIIVVGALVGLLFVALGYAQMVWLARQRHAGGPSAARPSSPLYTFLFWTFGILAAIAFLRAAVARTLPDRQSFLVGEDLFSVTSRPGLVAKYETNVADVRRDDVLLRFVGQDGEEGQRALKNRRQLLQGELELERARPLEFDQEIVRRLEAAKAVLRERDQRLKQLVSERDAITREMSQQRLAIANRRFRVEQDDRVAERELKPLRSSLQTERSMLKSQESLLKEGLVSQMEAARARDALNEAEGRVGQLEEKRTVFAKERREIANLRSLSEKNFAQQLDGRSAELAALTGEIEAARKAVELAATALEQDRPRALEQREKRVRQIALQVEELESLLQGRGSQLSVTAPWDGRLGFREPSPSSIPADNGPLLVLYRPGKIGATVRLEPGEADATDSNLRAEIQIASPSPALFQGLARTETLVPGTIMERTLLPGGTGELRIACDPPDRVVRQLAMGGTVPVLVRLHHGIVSTASFKLGLVFAALAIAVAAYRALRQRAPGPAEPPGTDPGPSDRDGVDPRAPGAPGAPPPLPAPSWPQQPSLPGAAGQGGFAIVLSACGALRRRIVRAAIAAQSGDGAPVSGHGEERVGPAVVTGRPLQALAFQPPFPTPALATSGAPGEATAGSGLLLDDLAYLHGLGVNLRTQVEGGGLNPGFVHQVGDALARSGYRAAALVGAGFGPIGERQAIERAAFGLLSAAAAESLDAATRDCAEFLRVMRTIGAERMNGALDHLRAQLIAAALDAAERGGTSSETAASAVKHLVEA